MFDRDFAALYGVPTHRLNEQVKRNRKRFPEDFMFQLTWEESVALASRSQIAILKNSSEASRSHFVTLKKGKNIKYRPYVFTEQGVAMLSSVLSSDRAIEVNIEIMRVFVRLKELMISHKDLTHKIEGLEIKFKDHDRKFALVFEAIKHLFKEPKDSPEQEDKKPIGFHVR